MYPLQTNRDVRKLKLQHKVRNMPKKRLPAMADRAVWEEVEKGRAGKHARVKEETRKRYCP